MVKIARLAICPQFVGEIEPSTINIYAIKTNQSSDSILIISMKAVNLGPVIQLTALVGGTTISIRHPSISGGTINI